VFAAIWLVVAVSYTFKAGPLDEPLEDVDNPIGVPGMGFVVDVLGLAGLAVLLIAAVTSLVLRFLRNPPSASRSSGSSPPSGSHCS
jgi:hypothetical protein